MTDIVSKAVRSRMMSGIRNKNTKPEILLRKGLYARGFRYRLNVTSIPGKPDMVLRKHNALVFAHGCFWHVHDCHLFKWPKAKPDWWREKLEGNVERDKRHLQELRDAGWRVLIVWECALKGRTRRALEEVLDSAAAWLLSDSDYQEIRGLDDEPR